MGLIWAQELSFLNIEIWRQVSEGTSIETTTRTGMRADQHMPQTPFGLCVGRIPYSLLEAGT